MATKTGERARVSTWYAGAASAARARKGKVPTKSTRSRRVSVLGIRRRQHQQKTRRVGGLHCAQIVLNAARDDTSATDMPRQEPVGSANVFREKVVGARGFEPPTPRSRTECSTRLSHAPTRRHSTSAYTPTDSSSTAANASWLVRSACRGVTEIHPAFTA